MPTALVIDDSEVIAFAVQSAVPEWKILYAKDGIEGLDLFRQRSAEIDLIVLDVQMPHLDGRATCVKIRSMSETIPILPFTSFPEERTLAMLRELGCAAPLLKPVHPTILAETLLAVLQDSPPPLQPATAIFFYTQELVSAQERAGRSERAMRVVIYADRRSIRSGLKDLLEAAGVEVAMLTPYANNIQALLAAGDSITAFVTTLADLPSIQNLAHKHNLPLLCIASTLAEGLTLTGLAQRVNVPRLGIVIESRIEGTATPAQIAAALKELALGGTAIPQALLQPFGSIGLSPQEQAVLTLEVQGLSAREISERLQIEPDSVRQYRMRLSQKLELQKGQTLREWAEAWWFDSQRA